MDANIKSELDAILAEKAVKDNKAREIQEKRETEEQIFQRQFLDVRDTVIKPAMEEIVEYLSEKGLGAEIDIQEESHSRQSRELASITIRFTMKYKKHEPRHDYPHLSVFADITLKQLRFHECTIGPSHGGHAGSAGECTLDKLTKELIHTKIMKVLKAII